MHLLIATGLYAPQIGGPATYTAYLEEGLPEKGYTLTVAPFSEVRHLPRGVRHLVYAWKLFRALKKADAVYALDPVSVGIPALMASRLRRKPLLLRVAGDHAWEQGRQHYGLTCRIEDMYATSAEIPPGVCRMMRWQRRVARAATRILVPSQYLKGIVSLWGVPESKIDVIYNSYDPAPLPTINLASVYEWAGPILVSAGRMVPWKGFQELIALLPQLEKRLARGVMLIIAGDGPLEESLRKKAEELTGTDSRIVFLGRVSQEELLATVSASDVFVLNTGYEGFSHMLLEVMATGTPIVTTDVGGNRELVSDGETGRMVAYGDQEALLYAIVDILENADLAERLKEQARKKAHQFSRTRIIEETDSWLRMHTKGSI